MRRLAILGTLGGLGLVLSAGSPAAAAPGYASYLVGNPGDAAGTTSPLWVMQGGGTDVDENFVRMGGGDFVVIRASGSDGYNGTFNVTSWTGHGGIAYTLSAENGVLVSSRGDIY